MKKIFSAFGIAILTIPTFATSVTFANESLVFTDIGYETTQEDILKEVPEINPLALEVVDLIENTFTSDFTADIDLTLKIDGESYDWDDNKTSYSIGYNSGNVSVLKKANAYDVRLNNESLSVFIEGQESYYPINLDISLSEKAILDFDAFQFAGAFSLEKVDTHGNESLQHITDGILEFVELFEDKWIVLDFVEIEQEFPELTAHIQEMKEDIIDTAEDEFDAYYYARMALTESILDGYVSIEKKGNEYTLSFEPNTGDSFYISEEDPLRVILVANNKGTISSLSVMGEVEEKSEWRADNATISIFGGVTFSGNVKEVIYPTITEDDWEVTNIIEMILEFSKDDILEKSKKRMFFENLNAFNGTADEAIIFLKENGTEADKSFVEEFSVVAKKLDRRIRLKDLQVLEGYYDIEDWQIEYLADDLSYSPYRNREDYQYTYKNAFEELIVAFQENGDDYAYIPWDIYDEMNFPIKQRGDILIALAKVRQAELMGEE